MEREEFYVVASKYINGGWNKFAKSYDLQGLNAIPFFWEEDKAKLFLKNNIPDNLREFYAVFKLTISLDEVEKVFDGRV